MEPYSLELPASCSKDTVAFGNSNHCFIVSPFAEATQVCMTLHSIQGCNDSPKPQLLFVMLRTS